MRHRKFQDIALLERRMFFAGPPLIMLMCIAGELVFPTMSSRLAALPLIGSLVFVGMPHGATDLAVGMRLRSGGVIQNLIRSCVIYVALMGVGLAGLILFPWITLAGFAVVSAVHFGLADARDLNLWSKHPSPRWLTASNAASRGVLILALPFCFHPAETWRVVSEVAALVGWQGKPVEPTGLTLVALLIVVAALVLFVFNIFARLHLGQGAVVVRDLAETCVLCLAFLVLHPMFAMGIYVVTWHSWRHLRRLARFFGWQPQPGRFAAMVGSWLIGIAKLHIASLPLLLPTLVVFLLLAFGLTEGGIGNQLAILTLAVFVVVTLPHHLLVEKMVAIPARSENKRSGSPSRFETKFASRVERF